MRWIVLALLVVILCSASGCTHSSLSARNLASCFKDIWPGFDTGSSASLRGISAVSGAVAWASGSGGTVLRTIDGGQTWQNVSIAAASDLDFRMIHAFDAFTAVVLNAGSPARLYRTEDGGGSWALVYEDARSEIFFDAMCFADSSFGAAFGDPIGNRLQIITTTDGGRIWQPSDEEHLPQVRPGEAGFAASNSGMAMAGNTMFIGLGGRSDTGRARIARSSNRGRAWTLTSTPMAATESSGIFSIAFVDGRHGTAVGGDYQRADATDENLLITSDGGRHWIQSDGAPPGGYRSAVVSLAGWGKSTFLAVGPTGSDVSVDFGQSWVRVDTVGWHAVSVTSDGAWLWSSGDKGRVGRIEVLQPMSNTSACP